MSDWKWRLYFFIRAIDATAENRQVFAEIFTNNGSLETVENERKIADSAIKLSTSGDLPAQVFGINTLVKADMRTALQAFIDSLPQSRWYATANGDQPNYADGCLIAANDGSGVIGQAFTWEDALADLFTERSLRVIETEGT